MRTITNPLMAKADSNALQHVLNNLLLKMPEMLGVPGYTMEDCGAQLPALSRRTRLPPMHPRARTPSPARRGPHQVGRLDVRARVRWHV